MKRFLVPCGFLAALAACSTSTDAGSGNRPAKPDSPPASDSTPSKKATTSQDEPQPQSQPEIEPVSEEAAAAVFDDLDAFTVDFFARASGQDNAVLSPASVALALGMVHAGAQGETADEIAKALHLSRPTAEVHGALATALSRWNAENERYELAVVNRLFGEKTVPFEAGYLDLTRAVFGAPLEPTDFANAPDDARQHINGWVQEQTHDRIEDLMPPGSVTPTTRLVLVNAVYFKAAWQDPFSESATQDQTFLAPAGAKKAPMTRKVGDEKGTEAAAATALGMRAGAAPAMDEPIPFVADHPFLYLIRDTQTDAILFMGRVVDPTAGA